MNGSTLPFFSSQMLKHDIGVTFNYFLLSHCIICWVEILNYNVIITQKKVGCYNKTINESMLLFFSI